MCVMGGYEVLEYYNVDVVVVFLKVVCMWSVVRTYRMSLGRFSGLCKATQMLMFLFLAKGTTFLSALSSDETVISCEEKITFAVYS